MQCTAAYSGLNTGKLRRVSVQYLLSIEQGLQVIVSFYPCNRVSVMRNDRDMHHKLILQDGSTITWPCVISRCRWLGACLRQHKGCIISDDIEFLSIN